ncbi:MAG: helix-turn-helix transcriptional regulator [Chloroflexota bacterium]
MQTINQQTTQQKTQDIYYRFGHSVRTVRRAYSLTQAQLAARAGMNKTYLVRIESGDKNVTLKTAQKLACALEIDILTLLKGIKVSLESEDRNHGAA